MVVTYKIEDLKFQRVALFSQYLVNLERNQVPTPLTIQKFHKNTVLNKKLNNSLLSLYLLSQRI